MRKLDQICEEGFNRIGQAVQDVLWKWDHKPYGNGLNDDTKILQACIDDLGRIELDEGVHVINMPLQVNNSCTISGKGVALTAIRLNSNH